MSNSFNATSTLSVNNKTYTYYDFQKAEASGLANIHALPYSLKILLENLLRHEDGHVVSKQDIEAFASWLDKRTSNHEIAYHPSRVLLQDLTGVPAVVDLAVMRNAMADLGNLPSKINPLCPVDLVCDHSVVIEHWGSKEAYSQNVDIEMRRNKERYEFLKWGQKAFKNFSIVPPGTGICHQVNLEYLSKVVWGTEKNGELMAYPDTVIGTDSHTPMVNGLGILAWGVGGIEAEAAMLGQPVSMLIPEVVGFKLTGKLREGVTATDLVLTCVQMLREHGVVGKFVEYFGEGLRDLPVPDRATLGNMAPEYGATCGISPIDEETLHYLKLSGRSDEQIALVEAYAKTQGLWQDENTPAANYTSTLELDLSTVEPSVAGPKRPQDRLTLTELPQTIESFIDNTNGADAQDRSFNGDGYDMHHGDIVIAAITSCTNTSNPNVMVAAGLVAQKAVELGIKIKPWVKPSLAPGSKVVTEYLRAAGLLPHLEALGFYLDAYGCTTCIGNSGPLADDVTKCVSENDITVCSVLSGNRNFEGRIHPLVKANFLASPPLVVAYALAGTTRVNLQEEALGVSNTGEPVFLKDIWPSNAEIAEAVHKINSSMYQKEYAGVEAGTEAWQAVKVEDSELFPWDPESTYVRRAPYFDGMAIEPRPVEDIESASILALLGDSVTTDHISPASVIPANSPAATYLQEHGVSQKDFNSYGTRRGNHEVMMRGTFANIRIRNEMIPGVEGGMTMHLPSGKIMPIYDAAMKYQEAGIPLVVIAGKEYGTGSSRDWAAKGPLLQGVRAVVTESFERIHRSNLIGMGIAPLQFKNGETRQSLNLTGKETVSIRGLSQGIQPKMDINMHIVYEDGTEKDVSLLLRIDTENEANYYLHGGILQYVIRKMCKA